MAVELKTCHHIRFRDFFASSHDQGAVQNDFSPTSTLACDIYKTCIDTLIHILYSWHLALSLMPPPLLYLPYLPCVPYLPYLPLWFGWYLYLMISLIESHVTGTDILTKHICTRRRFVHYYSFWEFQYLQSYRHFIRYPNEQKTGNYSMFILRILQESWMTMSL